MELFGEISIGPRREERESEIEDIFPVKNYAAHLQEFSGHQIIWIGTV